MPLYIDKLSGKAFCFSLPSASGATLQSYSNTATLDFPSTNGQSSSDLTISLTGAALGDAVSLGVPVASILTNSCYTAWVSAANTITVRFNNYNVSALNPASGTFKVTIIK